METIAWRYKPEFSITTLINNQSSGDRIAIRPSPATQKDMENLGFITRYAPGKLLGYALQLLKGNNWLPAFDITQAFSFTFWLNVKQGSDFQIADIFDDTAQQFGNKVFYANNLSSNGEIDKNITGNVVKLIPTPASVNKKNAALSAYVFSAAFPAGKYAQIKAGKITAGAPIDFNLSKAIDAKQTSVGLDFRLLPKGAYMVQLDGTDDLSEKVVFDEEAMGAGIKGFVDIHRDAWVFPSQAKEYRINFINT